MYQDGVARVLPAAAGPVGIAVLPATGGNTIFTYAAIAAISIGAIALMLQAAVIIYGLIQRSK